MSKFYYKFPRNPGLWSHRRICLAHASVIDLHKNVNKYFPFYYGAERNPKKMITKRGPSSKNPETAVKFNMFCLRFLSYNDKRDADEAADSEMLPRIGSIL